MSASFLVDWLSTAASESWRQEAACRGADPAVFFPPLEVGGHYPSDLFAAARSFCARCEVLEACLDDDVATGATEFGFRAGLTARARHELRMRRTRRSA
jgi:WhiB family redox-sensing transcriptional regulator